MRKIALITGASRGIGAATATLFAQQGYAVCINYLSNDAAARQTQEHVLEHGGQCVLIKADVSKGDEVERLFRAIDEQLGPVSVLVNNVGVLQTQSRMMDISEARFAEVLRINVMSCFLCSQAAVRRMSTRYGGVGGTIVNVSSIAAKNGSANEYVDYAASKGAMDTLTRGLALEVADEGVRVNAVRPGLIHTDIHASGGEPGRVERLQSRIPLQRGGKASEIAESIYWLASEKSSFVTGSFVDVGGGI